MKGGVGERAFKQKQKNNKGQGGEREGLSVPAGVAGVRRRGKGLNITEEKVERR